ncbi:hypothetical protein CXIVA_13100 [Clostridium sp. SY8519]|nr:hypothetical protein CXIVA_13100 [Clostridium sp. SY8519]
MMWGARRDRDFREEALPEAAPGVLEVVAEELPVWDSVFFSEESPEADWAEPEAAEEELPAAAAAEFPVSEAPSDTAAEEPSDTAAEEPAAPEAERSDAVAEEAEVSAEEPDAAAVPVPESAAAGAADTAEALPISRAADSAAVIMGRTNLDFKVQDLASVFIHHGCKIDE